MVRGVDVRAQAVDVLSWHRWLFSQLDGAARVGDFAMVTVLLQALATVAAAPGRHQHNPLGEGLIMSAAFGGDPEIVRALVEAGGGSREAVLADINKLDPITGQRPLHVATHLGHRLAVRALLFYGADVNAAADPAPSTSGNGLCSFPKTLLRGMTALHWASLRGSWEIVQDLVMSGADLDARVSRSGETALHLAARCGREAVVGVLLDAGCKWDVFSASNLTPMDLAASSNHRGTLTEFLYRGINPNEKNALGYTALHQAAYSNSSDTLRLLVEFGGDVNSPTKTGYTPLHVAAFSAVSSARNSNDDVSPSSTAASPSVSSSAVRTLARCGGPLLQVDAVDGNGSTPLRTACVNLRLEAVRDLLDIGADEKLVGDLSSEGAFVKKIHRSSSSSSSSSDAGSSTTTTTTVTRAESIARVVAMLASAPADRAWGRRGWLAVLRSRHAAEAEAAARSAAAFDGNSRNCSSIGALPASRKRSCSDVEEENTAAAAHGVGKAHCCCARGAGRSGSGGSTASSACRQDSSTTLLEMVASLEDEGVFRRIVLFL